ncbi:MAG: hypothetical protein Fur0010_14200 [Bdellovibrio sp.]
MTNYRYHLSKDGPNPKDADKRPFFLILLTLTPSMLHSLIMIEASQNQIISTKWIENLALEELNMEESGVINFSEHLDPRYFLEESSIDLMNKIRDRIEVYVTKFNQYRGNAQSSSQIRIFKISNTVNDFMLFRNSLRLIIARKSIDCITIGFLTANREYVAPRLNMKDHTNAQGVHEIKAHIGPFNKITWKFMGEEIDLDAMIRHYISEFISNSAR